MVWSHVTETQPLCPDVIREKGLEHVTVEDLVTEVTPKGRGESGVGRRTERTLILQSFIGLSAEICGKIKTSTTSSDQKTFGFILSSLTWHSSHLPQSVQFNFTSFDHKSWTFYRYQMICYKWNRVLLQIFKAKRSSNNNKRRRWLHDDDNKLFKLNEFSNRSEEYVQLKWNKAPITQRDALKLLTAVICCPNTGLQRSCTSEETRVRLQLFLTSPVTSRRRHVLAPHTDKQAVCHTVHKQHVSNVHFCKILILIRFRFTWITLEGQLS